MRDHRAAVIEIVERRKRPEQDSAGASLVVPNEVRINGQQILLPDNEPIVVHDIVGDDVVKVTLTVLARRIFIGHEDVDPEVTDAVAVAQAALLNARRDAADAHRKASEAIEDAQHQLAAANRLLAAATTERPDAATRLRNMGMLDGTGQGKAEPEVQP